MKISAVPPGRCFFSQFSRHHWSAKFRVASGDQVMVRKAKGLSSPKDMGQKISQLHCVLEIKTVLFRPIWKLAIAHLHPFTSCMDGPMMSNGNFPLSTWLDSQKSSVGSWHLVTSESAWPTESPSSHSERVGAYTVNDQLKCQCTLHGWGYVSYILDWCGVKNHCSWALASVHCARAPGYTLWYSHIWQCLHSCSIKFDHSFFFHIWCLSNDCIHRNPSDPEETPPRYVISLILCVANG